MSLSVGSILTSYMYDLMNSTNDMVDVVQYTETTMSNYGQL